MIFEAILVTFMAACPSPEATLVFAGDAMQHKKQIEVARGTDGTYSFDNCFDEIAPWVSEADYAVVNLETPLGDGNFTGYPCFNAPTSYAEALRKAGFDLMLTANNHTLDRRDAGLRRTIQILDSLKVDHIGTYISAEKRADAIPFIRDIKGYKVGFLNYTYGTNGIPVQGNVVVDLIDRDRMARDVKATREAGAEIVVLTVHWGIEYVLLPPAQVKALADYLTGLDVDMVIGGHPHVVQPMEIRENPATGKPVLLVYSMGNLISNMATRDTRGGAMVRATIERDKTGKARLKGAEYMPHFTVPGTSRKNNFRVVPLPEGTAVDSVIPSAYAPRAKAWLNAAQSVFDKHNRSVPRAKLAK